MPGIALPANGDRTQADLILDLQRRIAALETQVRLRNATVDEPGVLQVRDAAGNVRLKAGREVVDGSIGFSLYRMDGSIALRFAGFSNDPTFHEVVQLYDRLGNVLYGDDEASGQGISRPYLPLTPTPVANLSVSVMSTTSAAFTNLFQFAFPKQQPKVEMQVGTYTDVAGTSGQIDLYDVGTATRLAGPFSFTGGGGSTVFVGTVSGAHLGLKQLAIRGRVTSAGGSVGVLPVTSFTRG